MAAVISKRQQARHERQLQDLLRSVPGNDRCADCAAKNPGWASWNLGIFVCMRCAALHRKLGSHISKVKSLSMDTWSAEQVEGMRKGGNANANAEWNPKGEVPSLPVDADEIDAAMERFIRKKYESRSLGREKVETGSAAAQQSGETWVNEGPALPPKPGKKFGFSLRSASSSFLRSGPKRQELTPPRSPAWEDEGVELPPRKANKASQVFGMKINGSQLDDSFDAKLASLREMGFRDNRRNSEILKGAGGNLDKTIETLVRLGEGTRSLPPVRQQLTPPMSTNSTGVSGESAAGSSNGIKVEKKRQTTADPWALPEEPSQTTTMTTSHPTTATPESMSANSWNPFLSSQPAASGLANGMANMSIAQTSNPSFHDREQPRVPSAGNPFGLAPQSVPSNQWASGGPSQQIHAQQEQSVNPFLPGFKSATPQPTASSDPWSPPHAPLPSAQPAASQSSNPWQQPLAGMPLNPWEQQTFPEQQRQLAQPEQHAVWNGSNPWGSPGPTQGAATSPSPFAPTQQAYFQQQQPQTSPLPSPSYQQQPYAQQQQQQRAYSYTHTAPPAPISAQPTGLQPQQRHDKTSILALYNLPYTRPTPPPVQNIGESGWAAQQPQQYMQQQPRAQSPSQSHNPFASLSFGHAG